ncbi:uncharacterized protein cspp1a [Eucyclogobius newberryi]|uniref:uncharacterized protein cspp1a n=1 Tax=Eucyclogobius newberryi TaxID=166745 RepID=UPI003B5CD31D
MYNHRGTGLHFQLGAEYERHKQKLQEELQVEYKRYIEQKRHSKAGIDNKSQDHGLSLPIAERISEKEKLREERNREYNLFLQEQANFRRRGQFSAPSKPEEPSDFDTVHNHKDRSLPEGYRSAEPPTSRKDAATLTDIRSEKSRKVWDLRPQGKARQENSDSSEERFNRDNEEEIEFSHKRKPNGRIHKSKYTKDSIDCKAEWFPFDMYDDENNNDQNLTSIAPHKHVAERPIPTTTVETSARVFATGLLIGHSEEHDTVQKKKEQYKQALLSQIAEQRENKRKEKILELKVTATGATDPHRVGKSILIFQFMCLIMVSAVPPPLPPRVDHAYRTPHDEVYNYYGSRHPLEPILSLNQNNIYKPEGPQEFEGSTLPQQKQTTHQPRWPSQPDFGQRITAIPLRDPSSESNRQGRENYQDALKQQFKDNAEHRRREREAQELYDAKKENEMMTYNPWGRAGGGAPHLDQRGNLITDLDQMHKLNGLIRAGIPPAKRVSNPLPGLEQLGDKEREHVQRQDHYKEALKQQIEGNRRKQAEERERQKIMEEKEENRLAEERARLLREYKEEEQRNRKKMQIDYEQWTSEGKERHKGKSIKEKPNNDRNSREREKEARPQSRERTRTTQEQREPQLTYRGINGPKQEHYKESLKLQVEEKTQKQEEERERQKIIEEEERLAKERSRVLKEYEEEEPRNRRKLLDHLEEASQNHPEQVPGQEQHLQDYQQEVITELETLRRMLKNKKNHLETKLMQRDPVNEHYLSETRPQSQVRQAKGDAAVPGHRENVQFPTQKHHSTQENTQSLREFNQLKYRDTSSREELLHNYPDPPTDWPSLDIQQQALLREQRRRLELMKRRGTEHHFKDFWDEQEDFLANRNLSKEPGRSLPANTLFLDIYSCEEDLPRHSSAESQQRSSPLQRHKYEEEAIHSNKIDCFEPDAPSPSSDTIVNKVQQNDRHERPSGDIKHSLEHPCGDDMDLLSGRSFRFTRERPVSVGTVTMEPWLQTSTSEEYSGSRTRAHL